ncbi:hypothetical protein [Streptomyces sp. FH025]|uniref:hypothetical protein n=1 Tax=Streptomyces sp. FH025 TaxID=2815937 RepID=UPI001A9EEF54|nr:hypothetical protein [Streptomyces sp. FH025]MBO1418142.1 hypothetical protein [Streptomyces sp. FH025]
MDRTSAWLRVIPGEKGRGAESRRLTGYEFVQWPLCPGHPHPLEPVADGEQAWWRCPSSGAEIGAIGELG